MDILREGNTKDNVFTNSSVPLNDRLLFENVFVSSPQITDLFLLTITVSAGQHVKQRNSSRGNTDTNIIVTIDQGSIFFHF
jgi:hypothetical protein